MIFRLVEDMILLEVDTKKKNISIALANVLTGLNITELTNIVESDNTKELTKFLLETTEISTVAAVIRHISENSGTDTYLPEKELFQRYYELKYPNHPLTAETFAYTATKDGFEISDDSILPKTLERYSSMLLSLIENSGIKDVIVNYLVSLILNKNVKSNFNTIAEIMIMKPQIVTSSKGVNTLTQLFSDYDRNRGLEALGFNNQPSAEQFINNAEIKSVTSESDFIRKLNELADLRYSGITLYDYFTSKSNRELFDFNKLQTTTDVSDVDTFIDSFKKIVDQNRLSVKDEDIKKISEYLKSLVENKTLVKTFQQAKLSDNTLNGVLTLLKQLSGGNVSKNTSVTSDDSTTDSVSTTESTGYEMLRKILKTKQIVPGQILQYLSKIAGKDPRLVKNLVNVVYGKPLRDIMSGTYRNISELDGALKLFLSKQTKRPAVAQTQTTAVK